MKILTFSEYYSILLFFFLLFRIGLLILFCKCGQWKTVQFILYFCHCHKSVKRHNRLSICTVEIGQYIHNFFFATAVAVAFNHVPNDCRTHSKLKKKPKPKTEIKIRMKSKYKIQNNHTKLLIAIECIK